jgi:hypothetical protein
MFTTRCHIRLPQHSALICIDEATIRVFKYTDQVCEYDIFDSDSAFSASDWIVQVPTLSAWRVNITEE